MNHGIDNNLIMSKVHATPIGKKAQALHYSGKNNFEGISFHLAKIHNSTDLTIGDKISTANNSPERLNYQERVSLVLKWASMSPKEREKYDGNGGIRRFVSDNNAHYGQFVELCRMGGKLSARGLGCLRRAAGIPGPKITAGHIIEWQNMSPKNRAKMGGLNAFAAKYMLPVNQLYKLITSSGKIRPAGLKFLSQEILREQYLYTADASRGFHTTTAKPSAELYHTLWAAWENDTTQRSNELRSNAVAIMKNCLERKSVILNLSKLNLTSLPDIIPGHILELNVISNHLSMLPKHLPPNLQRLITTDNALTSLPQAFPEYLSELCLQKNLLTKFPEHLPKTISYLNISFNKMQGGIGRLPESLISLDLSNNKLNSMPDDLPNHLTWIDLSNNKIQTLPACIMNISRKTEIDIKDNPLTDRTRIGLYIVCHPNYSYEPKNIFF